MVPYAVGATERTTVAWRAWFDGHQDFRAISPNDHKEMTMLQEGKTLKTAVSAELEDLMAQLQVLREEVTRLTHAAAGAAEDRGRRMASDISDGVSQAVHYVERKGTDAEADLQKSVVTHPLMALGLAAGIGILIGAMTRR
jgi:ElaB/YqjD/DUF883 family membrane-anchored ribosome-binding protein